MDGARLVGFDRLDTALRTARTIRAESYVLGARAEAGLIAAAGRGANVRAVLSGRCFGAHADALRAANAASLARLRAGGVRARLSESPAHRKAIVADGETYADTRNFCGPGDLLVRTADPAETRRARRAFDAAWSGTEEKAARTPGGATKAAVLAEEIAALAVPRRGGIDLATESLGPCALTRFLEDAARTRPVRVVAGARAYAGSGAMRAEVAALRRAGARVRLSGATDKFALTPARAWIGSANASAALPAMSEWGAVLEDAGDRARLAERFEAAWERARTPPATLTPPPSSRKASRSSPSSAR